MEKLAMVVLVLFIGLPILGMVLNKLGESASRTIPTSVTVPPSVMYLGLLILALAGAYWFGRLLWRQLGVDHGIRRRLAEVETERQRKRNELKELYDQWHRR